MAKKRSCRYYVNTNFVVDLLRGQALREYGIVVYKLGKRRGWVAARVEEVLAASPRIGPQHATGPDSRLHG